MKTNAYRIEEERQLHAKASNTERLKEMYSVKYPSIKDLNKPKFWNEIYIKKNKLKNQDPMTKARINEVKKLIPNDKKIILDIGAGLGWIEEVLDDSKEVYANDFSTKAVEYLKKNFKGEFKVQSIYNLNYKKKYFDVVLLLEVLEHIPPSKIFSVLKSIRQLLKKDGVIIVSVPTNESLEQMKDNPSGHVRMYTEELISAELEISGFEIEEVKTLFAFNKFYKAKTLLARTIGSHKPNNIIIKATLL